METTWGNFRMTLLLTWIRNLFRKKDPPTSNCDCDTFDDFVSFVESPPSDVTKILNITVKSKTAPTQAVLEIPINIGHLCHLRSLSIVRCNLESIPWSFVYLKALKYLDLSFNKFKVLPNFIGFISSLEELDLENNWLIVLPTSLLQLKNLKSLKLRGNTDLVGPSYSICEEGLPAIMDEISRRSFRVNLWENSTTWYDPAFCRHKTVVPSLLALSVECILQSKQDFFSPTYVPPKLKHFLQETEEYRKTSVRVAKCGSCMSYFSSTWTFEGHVCNQKR